jgi:hypothetical protein
MNSRYMLGAYWPPRQESIEECCDRLDKFLTELAECDPVFATWYERGRSRKEASKKRVAIGDRDYVLDLLNRGRNRRDIGRDVIEELGFRVGLWNGLSEEKEVGLSITCGLHWMSSNPSASLSNCVVLTLPKSLGELSKAENMARTLAVVAEAWEPAWAGVMSRDAVNTRNFDAIHPFVDWMTYIPSTISEVPAPSSVHQLPRLGSIVIVQLTPPSGEPGELVRIRQIEEILQNAA